MTKIDKAVVLLSGGLDSATVLAMVRDEGYEAHALSFRYGQRHAVELEAADRVAKAYGAFEHRVIDIDLAAFGGSALTDDIPVPKGRDIATMEAEIPVTYVPARNTVFLSFALAYAEVLEAKDIFIGINALDYSGYPDCRPEFIAAFQTMANLATKAGVEGLEAGAAPITIHTPLLDLTKGEIISRGAAMGIDYGLTISCYDPDPLGAACGDCDSCLLRKKGFAEAGLADSTTYN